MEKIKVISGILTIIVFIVVYTFVVESKTTTKNQEKFCELICAEQGREHKVVESTCFCKSEEGDLFLRLEFH